MPSDAPQPSKKRSDEPAPAAGRSTVFRKPASLGLFALVAVAGVAGDLLSKHYVFRSLLSDSEATQRLEAVRARLPEDAPPDELLKHAGISRPAFPGVKFTLSTNPNVVFGLPLPRVLVLLATAVAVVLVGAFLLKSEASDRLLHGALGFVLAGALGNLYDRLFGAVRLPGDAGVIRGQVRDFIDCSDLYYAWVFNVADALLVIGVVALLVHSFLAERGRKKDEGV